MKTGHKYKILGGSDSYLLLQDVQPEKNRYRSYEIKISEVGTGKDIPFLVELFWGRIGGSKSRKAHLFDNQDELTRFLKPILRTRLRHGYRIIQVDKCFPGFEILSSFKRGATLPSPQLDLFNGAF